MGFEKNYGQVSDFEGNPVDDVLFRAKLPGYSIFITNQGVHYVLYQREPSDTPSWPGALPIARLDESPQESKLHYARINLNLLGASIDPEKIEYEEPQPGYSNYYLLTCPDGILGVKTYRKVRIREVYPGIDWVWVIKDGKLHHQFEVKAGADVSRIQLKVKWADVEVKDEGKKIVLSIPLGKIVDGEILAYQGKEKVEVSYRYDGDVLTYQVEGWNEGQGTQVIDPPLALLWATYYGGSYLEGYFDDWGPTIATDANGNVFVTGWTQSTDFPTYDPGGGAYHDGTHNGYSEVIILKFGGPESASEVNTSPPHLFQAPTFFQEAIPLQFTSKSQEPLHLALYNITGQILLIKTYPSTPTALVLRDRLKSELSSGLYFLSVEVGETSLGQAKLIKR